MFSVRKRPLGRLCLNLHRTLHDMRAVRVREFGDPRVMKVEEVPIPSCGSEQVLVKVSAAGVNPVDTLIRVGAFGPREFPYTPGFDAAGTVEAVGDKISKFKKGDRVFCSQAHTGAYAEYTLVGENACWKLPANASFSQGAAMGLPYFIAYRCLFQRANAKPGNTVLVHGASGGVGSAAVQICRSAGIRVFGTAGTEDGLKMIRDLGAEQAFNQGIPGIL